MAIFLAVDVGGSSIKLGLVSENFELLVEDSFRTQDNQENSDQIVENLTKHSLDLLSKHDYRKEDLKAIGIGVPGTAINRTGIYEFAGNLPFRRYPLRKKLTEIFNCPIYLGNDANFAGLAESRLGAGQGAENSVTLTLGTGMGAGVVINDRVYLGFNEAASEFGHTVMEIDGIPCTCGRNGCFESYVSATALIRQTKEAIAENPDSILAITANAEGKVSGRTSFNAWRNDCPVGTKVVKTYAKYLAIGIANVINSYMPDVVIIGGGISNEGQCLVDLCEDEAIKQSFLHGEVAIPKIVIATLGNKAGTLGAALFADDCLKDGLIY
ncbi:MAG: ROK family protein [Clostridiaceae bacterium]|nr:ROK family protein [Clostridiaceae bacterium]